MNPTTIATTWISGDDRLSVHVIPESGGFSRFGYLRVEGKTYESASDKVWQETSQWDVMEPWLYSFQWEDSVIAYQDIIQDETGATVILQIKQPYAEGENQMPFYYANFRFDTDGVFQNVEIKANILPEYSEYSVIKTESVTSLDAEEITGEIQKEYEQAKLR